MAGFLTPYGDKTSTTDKDYPDYISDLMKKSYGALGGATGMLSGLNGYQGSVAPWNGLLSKAEGAAGMLSGNNRDWSSQIAGSGQVTGDSIKGLMSPYASAVGDDTMRAISDSYDQSRAQAAARAASGVAFGGSGSALALENAQMDRSEAQDKSSAMHGILSDAFSSASGLAEGNAGREQSGLIGADNATSNNENRSLDAIRGLLSTGQARQSYDQQVSDLPWDNFTRFMSALPGAPTTQTQTDPQTIDWLGIIASLGKKAFGL